MLSQTLQSRHDGAQASSPRTRSTDMQQAPPYQGYMFGTMMEAILDCTAVDGRTSARTMRSDSVPIAEPPVATEHKALSAQLSRWRSARVRTRWNSPDDPGFCVRAEGMETSGSGGVFRARPRRNSADLAQHRPGHRSASHVGSDGLCLCMCVCVTALRLTIRRKNTQWRSAQSFPDSFGFAERWSAVAHLPSCHISEGGRGRRASDRKSPSLACFHTDEGGLSRLEKSVAGPTIIGSRRSGCLPLFRWSRRCSPTSCRPNSGRMLRTTDGCLWKTFNLRNGRARQARRPTGS